MGRYGSRKGPAPVGSANDCGCAASLERQCVTAKNRSKETAMSMRSFERIALALLLVFGGGGFGYCDLIEHAQAQASSAPGGSAGPAGSAAPAGPTPTTPTQPPTVNPSSPNAVQQPSSTTSSTSTSPATPSTPPSASSTAPSGETTVPANETAPSTTARSERRASVAKPRPIHHHRGRPALVTYSCSYLGCVRTYPWAFPCRYYSRYCYPYGYRPVG